MGPNNAGKSTAISALHLCAVLLAQAKRRTAHTPLHDIQRDRRVLGEPLNLSAGQFVAENVRHEFRETEARLELHFKNKAALYVIWPVGDLPFFYLEHMPGLQPRNVKKVKECYPSIGVIPTLAPIEHQETTLSPQHVKDNLTSKLVSRHFRNQLHQELRNDQSQFDELVNFIESNTQEILGLDLVQGDTYEGQPRQLDLYFREPNGTTERELFWAGDGIQIWMQVLFHLWRLRSMDSVVLDEPDVFLHPDLQRRLVRVLEDSPAQIILATHAPEMLSEASRDSVVIVDRAKRRSRRVSDERVLAQLNDVLGSGFNLRLAKALRSRVALFVEGKDMAVLKNIARAIRADRIYREVGLTVTAMEGASNRQVASSFGWLNQHLLDNAVSVSMILDKDYMTAEARHDIVSEFGRMGVKAHVWSRKELESYLLTPSLISRVSGAEIEVVAKYLDESVAPMKATIFSRLLDERKRAEREAGTGRHEVSITEEFMPIFEELWQDPEWRLHSAPAKDVLSALNAKLQDSSHKAVSSRSLSGRIHAREVPPEMLDLLLNIEAELTSPIGPI